MARLVEEWVRAYPFPDPESADPHGLLAWGGDLRPERLLSAYAQGIFPWYEHEPILWFSPSPRLVLPLDAVHIARSLERTLRRRRFALRVDSAFEAVITACAETPRPGQDGTWITDEMREAYCDLHRRGFAHSVEAWQDDVLVGGVYGISLGAGFFGESMFAHRPDASKACLVALVRQLRRWGATLFDCQVHTDHMERFGAQEWPRGRFLAALREALAQPTRRGPWAWSCERAALGLEDAGGSA